MNNQTTPEHDMALGRIDQWQGTVQAELQTLVKQATAIRQNIDGAKTDYKKKYFQKKFDKVQNDVISMLMTLQRLEQRKASMAPASSAVEAAMAAPVSTADDVSDAIVRNVANSYNPPDWS